MDTHPAPPPHAGFTLIEIAMVLVIMALLVGGTLLGRDLIRSAELRTIVTDAETYRIAITNYREKYRYLPGDDINASQMWASCTDVGAHLCNGNGDGLVEKRPGWHYEGIRAWQHLSLAGMVPGSYDGSVAGSPFHRPGGNVPASEVVPAASYELFYEVTARHHWLRYGTDVTSMDTLEGGAISPEDALSLDNKVDDGTASTGKLTARDSVRYMGGPVGPVFCLNSGDYDLSITDPNCNLLFSAGL